MCPDLVLSVLTPNAMPSKNPSWPGSRCANSQHVSIHQLVRSNGTKPSTRTGRCEGRKPLRFTRRKISAYARLPRQATIRTEYPDLLMQDLVCILDNTKTLEICRMFPRTYCAHSSIYSYGIGIFFASQTRGEKSDYHRIWGRTL